MVKKLVLILTFVIIFIGSHAQNDQPQHSVSILTALWEAGYVSSRLQAPWEDFNKIELAYPKVETMNTDPYRQSLQEHYALKKQALKADKGINLEGVGQENFNARMNEDNLIYRTRASAGVEWNLLAGGLLDHQTSAKLLDQELMMELENMGNNGVKQISYGYRNQVMYYFNKKKLKLLNERKTLAESKINVLTPLAQNREIPTNMLLDHYKQMIDISGQFNLYNSFNESVTGLIDTTKIKLNGLLPPFDVNIQALKALCGISSAPLAAAPPVPLKKSLLIKEIKFSTNLRYNYFDLINNTNNRNFISLGVNTSIPIRIFSKPYKAYHFHQQSLNWSQKKTKDNVQWLEISNLIYEFKYKLKQFAAWEEKQRIQKESLRIYQGLHQINDPSFHPIEALDALDAYYALELEKMDLLQQLYIKLGEIQVLLPQESVNRYIIPYQKQAQTTEWLTDVHTNSFIYTRGVIQSNDNKKEKVQIIIKDAKTDEIVGDVITTLPKGKFEVYFPKSGTYQYLIKLSNQNVLKGEFSIPDSSQFPAFMDQNVKINRQPNGKFELVIENGALDSISVGIEKAKNDVSEIIQNPSNPSQRYNYNDDAREQLAMQTNLQSSRIADAPNTSETTQTASVQNLKESNNESSTNVAALSSDSALSANSSNIERETALNMDAGNEKSASMVAADSSSSGVAMPETATAANDSLLTKNNTNTSLTNEEIGTKPSNDAEKKSLDGDAFEKTTTTEANQKIEEAINKETSDLNNGINLNESKSSIPADSLPSTKENLEVASPDTQEEKNTTTTAENAEVKPDSTSIQTTVNELPNPEKTKPSTTDSLSQIQPAIDEALSKSLNDLSIVQNSNQKIDKSAGSYSLDIRAAHVIQLVLDGLKIESDKPNNAYFHWQAHQLLEQTPVIAKDIKNRKEIDSLQIKQNSMIQNSTDSMSLDKSLAELNARLSTLELANKNVYKNYANQVNKPLKAELNKRTAPFLSSTETPPSPILVQQILFLQNLNDSLLVSANALRTEANSKKEPVQKNQLLRNAFDDEMKAQKVMQHMIMAMDSKGVFDLYNTQEITFLRSSTDEQIRSEFKSKKTYLATTDAIIGEPYYVKSSNTEKNIPVEKDFFYTVQIGAFKNTFYIEQWDEWQTIIGEKIENGLTRVMIGKEQTSEQAETSKKRLQDLGYADAFVVLYNNGERLPIREIIEIAENTDTTLYEKANKKAEKMKSWNRGMYLWSKSFLNHSTDDIIRDLKDWKIDHVILSPTTDPKNWEKAQPLITQLDQNEIGVEWMIGNNKWLGTPITSKLDSLKSQIDQWQIKTLHLDIEPHTLPDYKKQKDIYHQQYIQLIREANAFCKKHEMTLNASIPLGLPEDVLQTICDLGVSLTLMAYENPNIEAIQRRSQEEVKTGKENVIMALRAKDYKKSSELEKDLQILKDWVPSHITVIHDYNTYKQISSNEKR